MDNQKSVPQIRFKGFSDEWELRKLGEEATEMLAGGDVDKTILVKAGRYPVVANALTFDGIIGFYENAYRVQAPAVTITGRGDVGHAKARVVNFTPVVRLLSIKSLHDVFFLENAINTVHIVIESTGVPQLTVPQLAQYGIFIPHEMHEELKIGSFFHNLDHLITLQQRKLEQLERIKKSMLEKMFPKEGSDTPEVRFAGFTEPWKGRVFEAIALRKSEMENDSSLPSVEYEDIISGCGLLNKNIYEKTYHKSGILFSSGDVLFGKLRPYLQNWLVPDFSGIAVGDFWVLSPIEITSYFLFYLIQTPEFHKISNQSSGTKMPRADWKLVSHYLFFIPDTEAEQQKIGEFFRSLDGLINLQNSKLEKLRQLKQAFLAKMFAGG